MSTRLPWRLPGSGLCRRSGARLCLLVVLGLLGLITVAGLAPASATAAGQFSDKGHEFEDLFTVFDHRYWTIQTAGGVEVNANGDTGLTFSVPAEVTDARFFGIVSPKQDFFIKPNSLFRIFLYYQTLTWPPADGVSVELMVTVYDKTNKKSAYQMTLARKSNNYSRQEEYSLNIWAGTGAKAKNISKVVPADASKSKGWFSVVHMQPGVFRLRAGSLRYEFKPKVKKLGRTSWTLMVQGQQAYFGFQAASVGLSPFAMWSEKGFHAPSPEW
jgi:hypothetical protein